MSQDKGRKEAASASGFASACYFHTSFYEYLIRRVKME